MPGMSVIEYLLQQNCLKKHVRIYTDRIVGYGIFAQKTSLITYDCNSQSSLQPIHLHRCLLANRNFFSFSSHSLAKGLGGTILFRFLHV